MAVLHPSRITPSKLQVAADWTAAQPWWPGGDPAGLVKVGAYRFDDPAGAVGIEGILVTHPSGVVLQLLLTYRDAPLPGAEHALLGTMEHSVLGTRYTYDGCGDPVAVAALAAAPQAHEMLQGPDGQVERDPSVVLARSGALPTVTEPAVEDLVTASDRVATVVTAPGLRVVLRRVLDPAAPIPEDVATLVGTWDGRSTPVVLAHG